MAQFCERIREVLSIVSAKRTEMDGAREDNARAESLIQAVSVRLKVDGQLYRDGIQDPPTCSVTYGAAGLGYALYRLAEQRQDAKLLSQADLWVTRAVNRAREEKAFYNPGIKITKDTVGLRPSEWLPVHPQPRR